jgi:hypothetical protein
LDGEPPGEVRGGGGGGRGALSMMVNGEKQEEGNVLNCSEIPVELLLAFHVQK